MSYDSHFNFTTGTVTVAPSSPTAGTTFSMSNADAAFFADPAVTLSAYNVVISAANQNPVSSNSEIVRITAKGTANSGGTGNTQFTITRLQEQNYPATLTARSIQVGDMVANNTTKKWWSDIETNKVQISTLVFNVKDYGALGNNSNDDTSAIQATYTAAVAAGGGIIFLPSGIYHSSGIMSTSPNVLWRGSGNGTILVATTSNPAATFTGQAFVEDMIFDGGTVAANAVVQSVVTESSYPSLWKNVQWQNATSYQYVNNGCEDVTYIECRTPGNEGSPSGVLPAMQITVPYGMVNIVGGNIFGLCDLTYQQINIDGATIGPLFIENSGALNSTILNLDGCYIYDGGSGNNNCIGTNTNLSNIHARGCYFVAQTNRAWINGNIPSNTTITLDNCIFVWGPGTSGNNYILQASGSGTLDLRSYSASNVGSATVGIFNPISSPTTIIKSSSTSRSATLVIAASNSSDKGHADYVCTGTNDDVVINNAINAISTLGGGTLLFRAGTYNIASPILPKSNIVFLGEGDATIFVLGATAYFSNYSSGILNVLNNIKFLNFQINATALTEYGAFRLFNSQNIEWAGLYIQAGSCFGIYNGTVNIVDGATQNTQRIWIHDNYITGVCLQDLIGGGLNRNPSDWTMQDLLIEDNFLSHLRTGGGEDTNGVDIVGASNLTIRNNIVEGNLMFGNEADPNSRSSLVGNVLRPPRGSTNEICAIYIEDDMLGANQSGLMVIASNQIQSGQIRSAGTSGLHIRGLVIADNLITQNTSFTNGGDLTFTNDAIYLTYSDNAIITGNYCDGAGIASSGINIVNGLNNSASGNYIYNHVTGITESGTVSGNAFADNYFNSVTTPLALASGSNATVVNTKGANPLGLYPQGNITGATTFNRINGDTITATLTGNITVTLTAGAAIGDLLRLILTQDGTGSRLVTWPSNFKKAGGSLVLSTGVGAVDTISMAWDGTNWRETARALNLT